MLKNIIGLGDTGNAIAEKFGVVSEKYRIYTIDKALFSGCSAPEDFEKYPPSMKNFIFDTEGKTLVVFEGGDKLNSAILVMLEQIKHLPIQLLYIQPDRGFLSHEQKLLDRLAFGALQEMTRSGVFERMWLISKNAIEEHAGGLSLSNYDEQIHSTIVSTLHAINYFSNQKTIRGKLSKLPEGARISTFGFVAGKSEDRLFFPLDFVSDLQYIYIHSQETLASDKALLSKIRKSLAEKANQGEYEVRVSFEIHQDEHDFTYALAHTSLVQEYR